MLQKALIYLSLSVSGFAGYSPYQARAAQSGQASPPAGETGSRLPEFSVQDLTGKTVSAANLQGKVVLIDFWATWCQPCKREMPGYQKLFDRYRNKGFEVIGFKFSTMKDTENPLTFARRIGVHYPLIVATDQLMRKFGGIEGLPTTMIYDRKGVLRKKIIGFEYTSAVEEELRDLL